MSRQKLLGVAATTALAAGAATVVALATGLASAVTTHGTSMLPRFHSGDLAVVWASGGYHVGQIVAYWSPLLHTTVLHRIVAEHGHLFTFKGDHNSFVDPQRLPASAIKGSLLLHVPKAGAWLRWLRSPLHLALVGAALLFAYAASSPSATRPGRRGPRDEPRRSEPVRDWSKLRASAVPLALALAFVAISALAWSRPSTRQGREATSYRQQVDFSYRASVAPDLVYPKGAVSTGQPIFLDLVRAIEVRAHFRFSTAAPRWHAQGTVTGTVRLVYGPGWGTVLERLPPVRFASAQTALTVPIDLAHVSEVVAKADKETGVEAAMPAIVVSPVVTLAGDVAGQPFRSRFSPSLSLDMNGLEVQLADQTSGGAGLGGAGSSSQLSQSQTGSVYTPVRQAAVVTLLGRSLPVGTLRDVGGIGLAGCLAVALALAGLDWRRHDGGAAEVEARYGTGAVTVLTTPEESGRPVIDVVGMPALAKVAEACGAIILVHSPAGATSYYVDSGKALYRYRPARRSAQELGPHLHAAGYEPRHRANGAPRPAGDEGSREDGSRAPGPHARPALARGARPFAANGTRG
ncbi:MAG: S24/S26 family peptidase [Acidimicrobiales bacterium]